MASGIIHFNFIRRFHKLSNQLLRPHAAVELPDGGAGGCDYRRRAARKRGASLEELLQPDEPGVVGGKTFSGRIGRSRELDAKVDRRTTRRLFFSFDAPCPCVSYRQ